MPHPIIRLLLDCHANVEAEALMCQAISVIEGLEAERDTALALAEDRRKFILNGVETYRIDMPSEFDPAYSTYQGCLEENSLAAHRHNARLKAQAFREAVVLVQGAADKYAAIAKESVD